MLPTFRDTPADALAIAIDAERLGIDGIFVYDHLWPMGRPDRPALAPFPMLGAIAASTSRLFLGTLVARIGVVPDEILIAQFAALDHLAPGRVVAALGTGDHLSFDENRAYGVTLDPASDRRAAVGATARSLLELGVTVWVGGLSRPTIDIAESVGAVPNFWQASPQRVAAQAARSEVTWGGMAGPDGHSAHLDAAALVDVARPIAGAGASWLVFGWPVRLDELALAAGVVRAT
jgi:alkanesulfonate monooxygenase SsuD/methylene tetrahydromethanopterin reductase-like flavin-dependent oxidoreductase (luciferase family)